MARPRKTGVDYFQHDTDASSKKTLFTIETRFGNDGYAFWFKMLEILGQQETLSLDLSDDVNLLYLSSRTRVDEEKTFEILDLLARMEAINSDLWNEKKIVWCDNFVERLSILYDKRANPIPERPSSRSENPSLRSENPGKEEFTERKLPNNGVSEAGSTHSIGEDSIGENSIGEIYTSEVSEAIDLLNTLAETSFRKNTTKTKSLIASRIKEGYTLDDLKSVIRKKVDEWKGTEREKFIRPETLFGTKFEGYLNQKNGNGKKKEINPEELTGDDLANYKNNQDWKNRSHMLEDGSWVL